MLDIPRVDQDIYLLQDLTLSESFAASTLSTEVSVDINIEGTQKYEFPDREKFIHSSTSE